MRTLTLVFLLLTGTGCGTVVNLATPAREGKVYGGVKYDTDLIEKLVDGGATGSGLLSSPAGGAGAAFAVLFLAFPFVDLALSAVGDTLTLPLTRWLDSR